MFRRFPAKAKSLGVTTDDSFVLFGHNGENVVVHYRSSNTNSDGFDRNTFVTFVCDMSVETGDFRYISEGPVLTYVFELHTKYACPQGCFDILSILMVWFLLKV